MCSTGCAPAQTTRTFKNAPNQPLKFHCTFRRQSKNKLAQKGKHKKTLQQKILFYTQRLHTFPMQQWIGANTLFFFFFLVWESKGRLSVHPILSRWKHHGEKEGPLFAVGAGVGRDHWSRRRKGNSVENSYLQSVFFLIFKLLQLRRIHIDTSTTKSR